MELTLRYHDAAQRPASAAFLRGTDPAAWLRELARWGLAAAQLRCYLVPESIRSVRPAGLFVLAEGGELPADVLEPYGQAAETRLFVPVRATLWPATAPGELAAALLWPLQLLHPSIGLVGFDTSDELDLATLLAYEPPRPTDWSRALPAPAPRPPLQQLRVLAPTAEAVVAGMRESIGTQPLADLRRPSDAPPGPWQLRLDKLRHYLLQTGLARVRRWRKARAPRAGAPTNVLRVVGLGLAALVALGLLGSLVASLGSSHSGTGIGVLLVILVRALNSLFKKQDPPPARPNRRAAPPDTGALARLEQWLGGNLQDLEQKRQNEIERLLRLFGDNPAEALKYAIPLGGPYQNRGTARPSAHLVSRPTTFNLGGLGGGTRTDVWDLGDYHHDLRRQYLATAQLEVAAGRYQQAAYIHAHLLGDFLAAANVLQQGQLYREAAVLYKDHLHNPAGAAQCLERGGLLLEAAELFASLDQHEKAGDLYAQLAQPQLAARHYERGVTLLLGNEDYPAAARVLAGKLLAADRAQEVLLQGWASAKQPEVCLTRYFEVVAATPQPDLSACVQRVFDQHTPPERQVPLLHVLASFTQQHPDPALLATSREVAYTVVSAEASVGNVAPLGLLRHFLPTDRLLAADCSRYTTRRPEPAAAAASSPTLAEWQLDASIAWQSAISHRQQWVAVGVRDERLHLARGNWYGHIEYYSWTEPLGATTAVVLVADAYSGPYIVLRLPTTLTLETRQLPKNKHFSEALTVVCPQWLPAWPTRVALLPEGTLATAELRGQRLLLQRYNATGQQLPTLPVDLPATATAFPAAEREWPGELIYHRGQYYTYWVNFLLAFTEDGACRVTELDSEIYHLVRSPYSAALQLAVTLAESVLLWQPEQPAGERLTPPVALASAVGRASYLVSPTHLVSMAPREAKLYQLAATGAQLVYTVTASSALLAALPTGDRQHFALLEATGHLTRHALNPA
jgi:tetratricopeptide (TPR) repeat protein